MFRFCILTLIKKVALDTNVAIVDVWGLKQYVNVLKCIMIEFLNAKRV